LRLLPARRFVLINFRFSKNRTHIGYVPLTLACLTPGLGASRSCVSLRGAHRTKEMLALVEVMVICWLVRIILVFERDRA
jgi:hypothetical protein